MLLINQIKTSQALLLELMHVQVTIGNQNYREYLITLLIIVAPVFV